MKKGDKVRVIKVIDVPQDREYYGSQNVKDEDILTLRDGFINGLGTKYWIFEERNSTGLHNKWAFEFQLELVDNLEEIKTEAYKKGYEDARIMMTNKWYSENLYTEGMLKTKIEEALSRRNKEILDWVEKRMKQFNCQEVNGYSNVLIETLRDFINFIK
jgi:hypothetical protein